MIKKTLTKTLTLVKDQKITRSLDYAERRIQEAYKKHEEKCQKILSEKKEKEYYNKMCNKMIHH